MKSMGMLGLCLSLVSVAAAAVPLTASAAAPPPSTASVANNVTSVQANVGRNDQNNYAVAMVGGEVQITDKREHKIQPGAGCHYYFYGLTWAVRCSGTARVNLYPGAGDDQVDPLPAGLPLIVIDGGDGDDTLAGSPNTDVILGGRGYDKLNSGMPPSAALAGDWVDGGRDDDRIAGTDKADVLTGGAGGDLIYAWGGNDYVNQQDGEADSVTTCGDGIDTALMDSIDQFQPEDCETITVR